MLGRIFFAIVLPIWSHCGTSNRMSADTETTIVFARCFSLELDRKATVGPELLIIAFAYDENSCDNHEGEGVSQIGRPAGHRDRVRPIRDRPLRRRSGA